MRVVTKLESPILTMDHISLRYPGSDYSINDISLTAKRGEFISLIGPSGCGKSSLLNLIAGFINPTSGQIKVNEKVVNTPGPERGVVFQDLALFPWLTVKDNVEFGLKMQGVSKTERLVRVQEVISLVGLSGYEASNIADLSGGMKQRVAIARSIVTGPDLLLMDEPFSALDAQTREVLQEEMLRIQQETNMTIILVTHSIDEAIYLSNRVYAMQKNPGRIHEVVDIHLQRPRNPEVRITSKFNEYKRQFMQSLRTGFHKTEEIDGSGI